MIIRHKISVFKLCQLCFSNEDLTAPQLEPLSKLCFVFHLINALYRDSYHHHNLSVLVFWHLADFVCKLGLKGSTFNWNVQVQFNVWCRVIELLSDLLIVAKRAFVITRGLWQNMKDLESSFCEDQECVLHNLWNNQLE